MNIFNVFFCRISQLIIESRFHSKIASKKTTASLASEAKNVLNLVKTSPDFIEHMNENKNSNLSTMVKLLCTSYPSVISTKYRDEFLSACTIHTETVAAKSEGIFFENHLKSLLVDLTRLFRIELKKN